MIKLLLTLILLISCGSNTQENLALGVTTCKTFELYNVTYCENIYASVRTCYRDTLEYYIACEEYDRAVRDWSY